MKEWAYLGAVASFCRFMHMRNALGAGGPIAVDDPASVEQALITATSSIEVALMSISETVEKTCLG
jgi:hypothetical protein